jgi:hypothetical protein
VTLDVALTVQQELERRADETDRLRHQEVDGARHQAELARRRYMQVDPDNRMVADTLEAEWNDKLRALAAAQERYDRQRAAGPSALGDEQRAQIMALATDFPRLWNDPRTPDRERKRMARLLIEDVTLLKADDITVQVRFKGGATHTLMVPLPKTSCMLRQTPTEVIATIDQLLEEHTDGEIAALLNQRGLRSGEGKPFHRNMVARIRVAYGLQSRCLRLRARGLLDLNEIAAHLLVTPSTIKIWRRAGLLSAHRFDDRGQCLFDPPGKNTPTKFKHKGKTRGSIGLS